MVSEKFRMNSWYCGRCSGLSLIMLFRLDGDLYCSVDMLYCCFIRLMMMRDRLKVSRKL